MNKISRLLGLLLVGAALATPAIAQWKWRDAAGHVQYSDRPPPADVADKDILQKPNGARRVVAPAPTALSLAASAPPAPGVKASDPQLEAKRKQQEQEEAAKRKAEEDRVAKLKAESCQRARSYQRTLDDGIRIARTNDKGEREILDDKARAEEAQRTQQVIASDCVN